MKMLFVIYKYNMNSVKHCKETNIYLTYTKKCIKIAVPEISKTFIRTKALEDYFKILVTLSMNEIACKICFSNFYNISYFSRQRID